MEEGKAVTRKKRKAELVPQTDGLAEHEGAARAVNAEPWEPLPGMVKRQCRWCRYRFAAPAGSEDLRCPDCARFGTRPRRTLRVG